jgi:GTPase KRas protein
MLMPKKQHQPFFLLVANKIDRFYEREVSSEEGQELAKKLGCQYIETSAKTNISVQKVFFDLVRMLRGSKSMHASSTTDKEVTAISRGKSCVLM